MHSKILTCLCCALSILTLIGCSAAPKNNTIAPRSTVVANREFTLRPRVPVYVMKIDQHPGVSMEGNLIEMKATEVIRRSFSRFSGSAYASLTPENRNGAMQQAIKMNCSYLVLPQALEWEQLLSQAGVRPAKINVQLRIFAVPTGEQIGIIRLEASGNTDQRNKQTPLMVLERVLPDRMPEYYGQ